eukprot:77066_1
MASLTDHFDDCCSNSSISVVGDRMTTIAKTTDNSWASAYGSSWIQLNNTESITEYQLKINKVTNPSDGLMFVGVSSTNSHPNGRYSFYSDNKNFAYRSDGVIYYNSKYFGTTNEGYTANDVITLSINPFTQRIEFHKNGDLVVSQKYNIRSTNCYKLAVSLFHLHDSVSMIHPGEMTTDADRDSDIVSDIIDHNHVLSSQIVQLQRQLSSIKQLNRMLQFENDSLRKQNTSLTMFVADERNYIDWNRTQVLSWMMSIKGGIYLKYYEMLNVKLTDWDFNGKTLQQLDYVDIKEQLGIIDVEDRKCLYRQIQLLLANNKECSTRPRARNVEGHQSICEMCSAVNIKTCT